jgi:hypothetical protein
MFQHQRGKGEKNRERYGQGLGEITSKKTSARLPGDKAVQDVDRKKKVARTCKLSFMSSWAREAMTERGQENRRPGVDEFRKRRVVGALLMSDLERQ